MRQDPFSSQRKLLSREVFPPLAPWGSDKFLSRFEICAAFLIPRLQRAMLLHMQVSFSLLLSAPMLFVTGKKLALKIRGL